MRSFFRFLCNLFTSCCSCCFPSMSRPKKTQRTTNDIRIDYGFPKVPEKPRQESKSKGTATGPHSGTATSKLAQRLKEDGAQASEVVSSFIGIVDTAVDRVINSAPDDTHPRRRHNNNGDTGATLHGTWNKQEKQGLMTGRVLGMEMAATAGKKGVNLKLG